MAEIQFKKHGHFTNKITHALHYIDNGIFILKLMFLPIL